MNLVGLKQIAVFDGTENDTAVYFLYCTLDFFWRGNTGIVLRRRSKTDSWAPRRDSVLNAISSQTSEYHVELLTEIGFISSERSEI